MAQIVHRVHPVYLNWIAIFFFYITAFAVLFYALLIVRLFYTLLETNQYCLQTIVSQKSDQILVYLYISYQTAYSVTMRISA